MGRKTFFFLKYYNITLQNSQFPEDEPMFRTVKKLNDMQC